MASQPEVFSRDAEVLGTENGSREIRRPDHRKTRRLERRPVPVRRGCSTAVLEDCAAVGGRRRRAASRRDKGLRTFGARPSARRDSDKLSSFSFSPWLDARRWTARPWTPRIRRQTFGGRQRRAEIRQHGSRPRATASWDAVASHYPPRRVVRPCRTLPAACPADATIKDKDEPSRAHPRVDCPNLACPNPTRFPRACT